MILCVCVNTALDLTYELDELTPGSSHRVRQVHQRAGGKAVNAARVLRTLGSPCVVAGFAGGRTGEEILDDLADADLTARLTRTVAASRRTVAIVTGASTTMLNEPGGPITTAEWSALRRDITDLAAHAEAMLLSGSLPAGLPDTAYAQLARVAADAGIPVVVDAHGPALEAALRVGVDLAKPNDTEAAALLGRTLATTDETAAAACELSRRGAAAVVISRGERGLVSHRDHRIWTARLPRRLSGNPTGAGDALAAVLTREVTTDDWASALRRGVAVSASAVTAPVAGAFDPALAEQLSPTVEIQESPCRFCPPQS